MWLPWIYLAYALLWALPLPKLYPNLIERSLSEIATLFSLVERDHGVELTKKWFGAESSKFGFNHVFGYPL